MNKRILFLIFLLLFSLHASDYSVLDTIQKQNQTKMVAIGTELSYEDGNLYFSLIPHFEWTIKAFRVSLEKPIRLLVWNRTYTLPLAASVFPKEEWDDVRDYIEIIDNLEYGNSGDLLHIRIGEVKDYSLGVASPFSHYRNDILFRFPRRAATASLIFPALKTDLFVNDIVGPTVLGGRVAVRPIGFFSSQSYGNNLEIGFSFGGDVKAPETTGLSTPTAVGRYNETYLGIYTGDISFRVLAFSHYHLSLYSAFSTTSYRAMGGHTGLNHQLMFSGKYAITIRHSFEYRLMGAGYEPDYFDQFYDVQRYRYRGNYSKLTDAVSRHAAGGPLSHGLQTSFGIDIDESLSVVAQYRWRQIDSLSGTVNRHDFSLNLFVRHPRWYEFQVGFAKNTMEGEKLFTLDSNALLFDASLKVYIIPRILAVKTTMLTSWTHQTVLENGTTFQRPAGHVDYALIAWGELHFD